MKDAQYPPNGLRYVKFVPSESVMTDPSPPVVDFGAPVLVGNAEWVDVLDDDEEASPLATEELGFLMTVK